jgi:hypothetical protein
MEVSCSLFVQNATDVRRKAESMTTLAELKQRRFRITIHCEGWAGHAKCAHYHEPCIDQLIQYLGLDFDLDACRAEFLARFVCEVCGGRSATLRLVPANEDGLMDGAGGAHQHGPMPSAEERRQRAVEFEAEFRSRGGRTNAEIAAYWRKWRRDQELAIKGKGDRFIGPPNPFPHRTKGP